MGQIFAACILWHRIIDSGFVLNLFDRLGSRHIHGRMRPVTAQQEQQITGYRNKQHDDSTECIGQGIHILRPYFLQLRIDLLELPLQTGHSEFQLLNLLLSHCRIGRCRLRVFFNPRFGFLKRLRQAKVLLLQCAQLNCRALCRHFGMLHGLCLPFCFRLCLPTLYRSSRSPGSGLTNMHTCAIAIFLCLCFICIDRLILQIFPALRVLLKNPPGIAVLDCLNLIGSRHIKISACINQIDIVFTEFLFVLIKQSDHHLTLRIALPHRQAKSHRGNRISAHHRTITPDTRPAFIRLELGGGGLNRRRFNHCFRIFRVHADSRSGGLGRTSLHPIHRSRRSNGLLYGTRFRGRGTHLFRQVEKYRILLEIGSMTMFHLEDQIKIRRIHSLSRTDHRTGTTQIIPDFNIQPVQDTIPKYLKDLVIGGSGQFNGYIGNFFAGIKQDRGLSEEGFSQMTGHLDLAKRNSPGLTYGEKQAYKQ